MHDVRLEAGADWTDWAIGSREKDEQRTQSIRVYTRLDTLMASFASHSIFHVYHCRNTIVTLSRRSSMQFSSTRQGNFRASCGHFLRALPATC